MTKGAIKCRHIEKKMLKAVEHGPLEGQMTGSSKDEVLTVCGSLSSVRQGKERRNKGTTRNEEDGQIHEKDTR
jgi:hypothetical protein